MSIRPLLSVVIPTFRRSDALEQTLRSLSKVTFRGSYEVIVVDDGPAESTSGVVQRIRHESTHMALGYFKQQHGGAARARNRGAREARGEMLIFLDDDMTVDVDHLDRHVKHLASPDAKRIVNGHWEFAPEIERELERSSFGRFRLWIEAWYKSGIEMQRLDGDLLRPSGLTACDLGIRRDHFFELGGFDESFPAAGYEDQEFALRARRAGFEFIYDKRIVLTHLDHRTTLDDFSERVKQGAFTAGIMARKYPEEFESWPLIIENTPASRQDGLRMLAKKFLKALAATKPGRTGMRVIIGALDRVAPNSRLMHTMYWKWCGIWIRAGVREGLQFHE